MSGQVAIGEFINQFKIEKPSGQALKELIAYLDQRGSPLFCMGTLICHGNN